VDDDLTEGLKEAVTFFHLLDEDPYDPIHRPSVRLRHDIRAKGYAVLAVGSEVTITGMGRYEVTRSSFHVGHPDELPGMHVFLNLIEAFE
jgi:hypothetical protein